MNPTMLPASDKDGPAVRAPKSLKKCINVPIFGHRDPRGPDNNLRVWVDDKDKLHIRIEKTNRCYKFERVINHSGCVEIIAS